MNAASHAATALLLKTGFKKVPMVPLLISVQTMEIFWVTLNFLRIEAVTTETEVRSIADIHLSHMPFSHSVAGSLAMATLASLVIWKIWRRSDVAIAVAIGILSHLVLDLAVHAPDIPWAPFFDGEKMGTGLYASTPLLALGIETVYGLVCWIIYRGNWKLLATILGFNFLAITSYTPLIVGSEQHLANDPQAFVTFIAFQIAITLFLVWLFSRQTD